MFLPPTKPQAKPEETATSNSRGQGQSVTIVTKDTRRISNALNEQEHKVARKTLLKLRNGGKHRAPAKITTPMPPDSQSKSPIKVRPRGRTMSTQDSKEMLAVLTARGLEKRKVTRMTISGSTLKSKATDAYQAALDKLHANAARSEHQDIVEKEKELKKTEVSNNVSLPLALGVATYLKDQLALDNKLDESLMLLDDDFKERTEFAEEMRAEIEEQIANKWHQQLPVRNTDAAEGSDSDSDDGSNGDAEAEGVKAKTRLRRNSMLATALTDAVSQKSGGGVGQVLAEALEKSSGLGPTEEQRQDEKKKVAKFRLQAALISVSDITRKETSTAKAFKTKGQVTVVELKL